MAEIATSDGFGSNFSGMVFCLVQPIGGLLVDGLMLMSLAYSLKQPLFIFSLLSNERGLAQG